jgi:hypothetical protein
VEGSGWPYWPPILPNNRTVMSHTGIVGVIIRMLYEIRYAFFLLGIFVLIAWIYHKRYEDRILAR